MRYTHLGRTGLQVSRHCLGTMNFGELTDETAAFAIMDRALEAGINVFDTAGVYGGPQTPWMRTVFDRFGRCRVNGWTNGLGQSRLRHENPGSDMRKAG